jgi:hypothetical protein
MGHLVGAIMNIGQQNAKMVSGSSFFTTVVLALAVLWPGVSNAAKTHVVAVSRIEAPPAGKALVNIHRVFENSVRCPIFDESGKFLMDLPFGECQLVCEPGQKSFITWFGANPINVVTADLAPDKTYDLVFYIGGAWQGGLFFVPLSKASNKWNKLEKLEKEERNKIFALERDDAALKFEASQQKHINEIKADFLGGKKSDRVVHVNKDDGR